MAQNNPFSNISIEQAMSFAASPAGQTLIAMLEKQNSSEISKAQKLAESGNMEAAKKVLSSLLADPGVKEMLKKFGG